VTQQRPADDVPYEWGNRFRLVVEKRDDDGEPKVVRLQMRNGDTDKWRSIATNYDVTQINVVTWARNNINKYVKRWRQKVDRKAVELQTELEKLVVAEVVLQQHVGDTSP